MRVCASVCVYMCMRDGGGGDMYLSEHVCACACACVCVCASMCVYVCVCVCACARMYASRAGEARYLAR